MRWVQLLGGVLLIGFATWWRVVAGKHLVKLAGLWPESLWTLIPLQVDALVAYRLGVLTGLAFVLHAAAFWGGKPVDILILRLMEEHRHQAGQ
jgi:glycerol-3-phosphate acyltransferase PlsY